MNRKDKIEALKRQLILHPSYLTIIEELEKDLEECLTNYLFHLKPFVVEKYYYLQAMVKNGL